MINIKLFYRLLVLALLLVSPTIVGAQSVEVALMPGLVIEGHAKYEEQCEKCHVKFDKAGQKRVCMDCHKETGKDVLEHKHFHGRMQDNDCRRCHADHKGRDASVATFDKDKFDHAETGFVLRDRHHEIKCLECHKAKTKYRAAVPECNACHKKIDDEKGHRGELGPDCGKCHGEKTWKDAKFDHEKTKFPIAAGKHKDVKCKECHIDRHYKKTPKDCNACHKKVDQEKGHKGRYGAKCETCHNDKGWKEIRFDHDRSTKYPLKGKHKETKCDKCHLPDKPLYKQKLSTKCVSCHKKDDKHKGQLGQKCEDCHDEKDWKNSPFDHNKSRFPLTGAHAKVECKKCHLTPAFKDAKMDCYSCHKDPLPGKEQSSGDVHKRAFGTKCESCHNTRSWKSWDFDHDKTTFKLAGGHVKVKCKDCHSKPVERVGGKLAVARACAICHGADDVHDGGFGPQCDRCHVDADWRTIRVGGGMRPTR